jgi:LysR family transcriptional regulator for metE and metH
MDINNSQLNINHLKMIATISQSDTVKEAAQKLFISQPALTNRIREAERRLNTRLFVHHGRKLVISSAGKRLLHSANKILEELARAEYDIARLSHGIEQVLRLGLPHYASFKWLPSVVSYFHRELPNIELEITANAAKQPLTALYNGELDIALISSAQKNLVVDDNAYGSIFILRDELLVCLSSQHKYAGKAYLNAQDFFDETYITNSTVPEKDREYELFFKPHNIIPRKVLQVGFNEAIIELVKVNMGVSILSKQLIQPYLSNQDIHTAKLGESGLNIYWHLVYLKQDPITEPAQILISLFKQYAKVSA